MQDEQIVSMFLNRNEKALQETQKKYECYLMTIAKNILSNHEDSQECVNETYFRAWNSIPPHEPQNLGTYLGKIVRQLSIDTYRTRTRGKRQASQYAVCLEELGETVPDSVTTEEIADAHQLEEAITIYLRTLSKEARMIFISRYYYMDSIREIALHFGIHESKVKSMLHRTRKSLKKYLQKEGFEL